jgi:hypothetical protein
VAGRDTGIWIEEEIAEVCDLLEVLVPVGEACSMRE